MTMRTVTVADNCATTFTADGPRVAAGDSAECRIVRETLSQLGDKWTLLVILCLSAGPLRFNALQRAVVGHDPPRWLSPWCLWRHRHC